MKIITFGSDNELQGSTYHTTTNAWSCRRSHPMNFLSIPSFRSGGDGLDYEGLFCYNGSWYSWVYARWAALVSWPRLNVIADFLRLFPNAQLRLLPFYFLWGNWRFWKKGGWIPPTRLSHMAILHGLSITDPLLVIKVGNTFWDVAWVREGTSC